MTLVMKYILLIFLLTSRIPLFSQSQEELYKRGMDKITFQYQFKKVNVETKIKRVLNEVSKRGTLCPFYKKDSVYYIVSIHRIENHYYLFVRPYYFSKSPDLHEYNIFGVATINQTVFLFYGLDNEMIFTKNKKRSAVNSFEKMCFTIDTSLPAPLILCDGCSQTWYRNVRGEDVLIEAEICKVNAKPLR